jgi:hypothetical protein
MSKTTIRSNTREGNEIEIEIKTDNKIYYTVCVDRVYRALRFAFAGS